MIIRLTLLTLLFFLPHSVHAATGALERKHDFPVPDVLNGVEKTFYSIEAYVTRIHTHEDCKGKKCDAPHVLVSKQNRDFDNTTLKSDILLYTSELQDFEVGKKYLFLIQTKDSGKTKHKHITDFHEIPEN